MGSCCTFSYRKFSWRGDLMFNTWHSCLWPSQSRLFDLEGTSSASNYIYLCLFIYFKSNPTFRGNRARVQSEPSLFFALSSVCVGCNLSITSPALTTVNQCQFDFKLIESISLINCWLTVAAFLLPEKSNFSPVRLQQLGSWHRAPHRIFYWNFHFPSSGPLQRYFRVTFLLSLWRLLHTRTECFHFLNLHFSDKMLLTL